MTARSSTGNFRNFGKYFWYKLRSLRSPIVLNSIFALLSYPLVMAVLLPFANVSIKLEEMRNAGLQGTAPYLAVEEQSATLTSLFAASTTICMIALPAMFLMNYVLCSKAFRWLYKKSIVDMDYSLPVSDDTRFFGDLLASLSGSLVPHILAIAIASGLYWCLPFKAMEVEANEPALAFGVLMQFAGTGLFACVMFTGICLLVMSLCGRVIEARIMPFVINVAIPAIHALCIVLMVSNMYGYSSRGDYEYIGLASTSPLGLLIMTFVTFAGGVYGDDLANVKLAMLRPDVLIPLLIITVGAFVAAYFLIRIRRAERVGSPYVFPAVKTAIPAVVTFTIVAPFMAIMLPNWGINELSGGIAAMIILTFIVYIIMELISGKGFKKFHITLGKYAATMVGCVLVCMALFYTNGLGLARLVPESDDVISADIDLYTAASFVDCSFSTDVTDAESLEAITEYHRNLPKSGDNNYTKCRFSVDYHLKSGRTLSRSYYLTREQYIEALSAIVTPEVYHDSNYRSIYEYRLNAEASGEGEYNITGISSGTTSVATSFPVAELDEALRKDCENITLPLILGDTSARKFVISFETEFIYANSNERRDSSITLTVYSWQKNVCKLLSDNGMDKIFAVYSNTESSTDTDDAFDHHTDKCSTAFAVLIPTDDDTGYNLNVRDLLLASVHDQLTDEQLEQYGYYYDKYGYFEEWYYDYENGYDRPVATVEVPYYNIISSDWKLYSMAADDANARKLYSLSSDIFPLDYSKVYSEKEYIIALVFTDASYERMVAEGDINYDYEIVRFVKAENYDRAMKIIDNLE